MKLFLVWVIFFAEPERVVEGPYTTAQCEKLRLEMTRAIAEQQKEEFLVACLPMKMIPPQGGT